MGPIPSGVVLLHDITRSHVAVRAKDNFNRKSLDHQPTIQPDIAPADFHSFPKLTAILGGKQLSSDDNLYIIWVEDDRCEHCMEVETDAHVIFRCERYEDEGYRMEVKGVVGRTWGWICKRDR